MNQEAIDSLRAERDSAWDLMGKAMDERDNFLKQRDALAAENKALRKDAERYRWLRIQDDEDFCFAVVKNPHFDIYEASELDAAIDEELTKEATNG